MRQGTVIVMVKEPRPGRVKTRLAPALGATGAAWWVRHQVAALLRRIGRDPRWRLVLALAPDTALARPLWQGAGRGVAHARVAQGSRDLGWRMLGTLARAGSGPVALIGADIPGVRPAHLAEALRLAAGRDWVLGPATDGGYWLIGVRHPGLARPRARLAGVRWSGPHAFADTLARLGGARVGYAATLADVDVPEDLGRG